MYRVSVGLWLSIFSYLCVASSGLPLKTLLDDDDRDYWLPTQVNKPGLLAEFQKVVSSPVVVSDRLLSQKPINIALIYPSNDVSDFWRRNYIALTKRLLELNIPYTTEEFESRQIQHALQSNHVDKVLNNKEKYDIVIFGPSELSAQAKNINRLAATPNFHTFVWAFHTPMKLSSHQPKIWFDFSSSVGANVLCQYLIKRLGSEVAFSLNRGIPGVTDDQRSGEFKDCVERDGQWLNSYEHYGQYQTRGGSDGAKLVCKHFPEVKVLHNANTAMAVGAVNALEASGDINHMLTTGWGGTSVELKLIREGRLNATPMRMSDDVGVASAEAIKFILQKRDDELPMVYLGRITIASDDLTPDQMDTLEKNAFRYSGVGVVK